MVFRSNPAEALIRIQFFDRESCLLNTADPFSDAVPDLREKLKFKPYALFLRSDNLLLHFFQLRCHVAFGICQGLFPDIPFRNKVKEAFGHLNIIAEYFIVLNPEVPDARIFPLFCFQVQDPLFSVRLGFAVFIQYG